MANPTTNFGWVMPTSTDLVTDLPADFAVFGQAVDTSMADLKGGTTGQVLAKATNTDMDFTWVAQDDSNAIQNTIVDAKGDLIAASGSDVPARLAVGNNGETLVADSSTSTGLRYQASMAAGKNTIINGGMDIWQRGTASQTPSNGAQMNVDRFYFTGGAGVVLTQDTDVPTSPYFQYSLKTVDAANYGFSMGQKIEAANSVLYAGQTVTVSFWAKTTSGTATMIVNAYYPSAKDNFASLTLIASNSMTTPTSTWTRFSTQFTLPSNVQNGLMILIGRGATTNTSFYTGVQLELGSVATSFQRAGATIQGELAACQRYYFRYSAANNTNTMYANAFSASTSIAYGVVRMPNTMRIKPSFEQSGTAAHYKVSQVSGNTTCSVVPTLDQANEDGCNLTFTTAAALVAGQGCLFLAGSTSSYLGFSAEL